MNLVTLETGHKYDSDLFDPLAKISALEVEAKQKSGWVAKFNYSKLISYYRACKNAQQENRHSVLKWVNSQAVCSCGLVLERVSSRTWFFQQSGHIETSTKKPTSFFIVNRLEENSEATFDILFCQSCGPLSAADLAGFELAKANHNCKTS